MRTRVIDGLDVHWWAVGWKVVLGYLLCLLFNNNTIDIKIHQGTLTQNIAKIP
jgi:hypothetical protein